MNKIVNTKPPVINITRVETGFTQSRIIFSTSTFDSDLVGVGVWSRESSAIKSESDYLLVENTSSPVAIGSLTPATQYTVNIAMLDEFVTADSSVLQAQYLQSATLIDLTEAVYTTLTTPFISDVSTVSGGREIGNNFGAIDFTIGGGSPDTILRLEVLDLNNVSSGWKTMYFGGFATSVVVSLPSGEYQARVQGIRRFVDNTEDLSGFNTYGSNILVSGSGIAAPNPVTSVVVEAFKSEEVVPVYSLRLRWEHDDTTNGIKRNFSVQMVENPGGLDPSTLSYALARTDVAIDSSITISPFPYRKLVAIKITTEGFGTLSSSSVYLNVFISSSTADSAVPGYIVPVINSAPSNTKVQIDDQFIRGYKVYDVTNPLLNNISFEFDAATGNVKIGSAGNYAGEQITTPFLFDAVNARLQISGHTITDKITAADYVMGWLGGLPPKLRTANRVTYDDTAAGLWAGYTDAATFKFNLGDSTKYIKWDGSNLVISGNVTIDGGPSLSQMQREVFVYIRSASAPSTPTGGSVNFGTGVVTPPASWSLSPPTGTNPLYMSSRLFTSDGQPPQSTAWTTPGIIASNGNFIEFRYQASSTQPATPTGNTPAGWSTTPPTGTTLPVWVVQGTKNAAGTLQGTWSTPVRWNGLDGAPGEPGAPGAPGEPGAPAKSIIASSSRQYFTYTSAGVAVPASQSAIISFTGSNLGTVTFTTSPTVTLTGTGSTRTLDVSAMGANEIVTITVSDGSVSDSVSVVKLRDGAGGLVGFLTNESHVVSAASNGTDYSLTGAGGTFRVFQGLSDVTTSCTFSVTTATISGLTMSINASTGVYSLSGGSWSSDSASFTLNAVFNGSTISKVYSISKSKAGTSVTGARGAGFWRISTGTTASVVGLTSSEVTAWFTNASVGPNVGAPVFGDQLVLINTLGQSAAYTFTTAWSPATAFINGSMVVNGSIGAESLTVDVLNGKSGTIGLIQTRAPGASDRPRVEVSSTQIPLSIQNNAGDNIFSVSTLPSGEAVIDLRGRLQNNTIQDAAFFTRAGIDRLRERLAEPPEGSSTIIYGGYYEFLPTPVSLTTPTTFGPANYIAAGMLHNNGQQITARLKLTDFSGLLAYNPSTIAPTWEVKIRFRTSTDGVTWTSWADIAASVKSYTGWILSSNEPGASYTEYGISALYEHIFTLPNPEGTRLEFMAQARRTAGNSTNPRLSEGFVQAPVKIEGMVGGLVLTKSGTSNILTSADGSSVSFSGATATEAGLVTNVAQTFVGEKTFTSTIAGSINGNAATATTLATGRTISMTGDVTWTSASFNGSGNVTGTATLANSGVTAGTYTKVTVDAKGRVTTGANLVASDIPTGISITGNASTATTLQTASTINGTSFNGSANITTANWGTARTLTVGDTGKSVNGSGNVSWTRAEVGVPQMTTTSSVGTENNESCIAYVSNPLLGASDGALYSHVYSSAWKHQIQGDYRTGQIAVRGKNNNVWQPWRTVLDSGNFNTYSPTLTGAGASGTWGISISGNAATATALQTSRNINRVPFNGSSNIETTEWFHSFRDFPNGTLVTTNINYAVSNGDPWVLEVKGNSYGPGPSFDLQAQGYIYYDSIINIGGHINGFNMTGIIALNIGGNLCFWWPNYGYWQGFNVRVYAAYQEQAVNRVVSITNSADPGGAKRVTISDKLKQSLRDDNFSTWAVPQTDVSVSGGASKVLKTGTDGYLYLNNWLQSADWTGLFWPNGTHWSSIGPGHMRLQGPSSATFIRFENSGGVGGFVYAEGGSIGFLNSSTAWSLRVDASSFVYASRFYAQSSIRYKDIEYRASAQDSINRVKAIGQLGVAVGRYKDRERHKLNRWVIAEEVAAVTAEAVALDDSGRPDSVDYDQLIPDLYAALANALERIERLEGQA